MACSTKKLLVSKAVRDKFGLSFIMMIRRVTTWAGVMSRRRVKETWIGHTSYLMKGLADQSALNKSFWNS